MIELCLALALFALSISYISFSLSSLSSMSSGATNYRHALYVSKTMIEDALASSTAAYNSVTPFSVSDPPFYKTLTISDLTPCKKNIEAQTTWNEGVLVHSSTLSSLAVDLNYAKDISNDCEGSEPTHVPHLATLQSFLIASGTTPTSLDVFKSLAYIGVGTQSTSSPGFYIVDNSNPISARIISSLSEQNISALDAIKNYVFLGINNTTDQFHIIDTTNPLSPQLIATTSLPKVVPTGSFPGATSIFYYHSKVFIGTHRTAGPEFHIFDVSIPKAPKWLGSIELNHNINEITVRDSYAYLATSGNTKDIIILDIHDPTHITQVASVAFQGNEDTTSIFLIGNKLYAGRNHTSSNTNPELQILDVSNPLLPQNVSVADSNGTIQGIKVAGAYAFIISSGSKNTVTIFDISSTTPQLIESKDLGAPPIGIDYENMTLSIILQNGYENIITL